MGKRTIEQLNLMEDFLFQEVLNSQEAGSKVAQLILSVILQRPIGEVVVQTQKIRTPGTTSGHAIRMDAYIEEAETTSKEQKGVIYDVEPHLGDVRELPKRSRYYQALIDSGQLKVSESYRELGPLWIIIITSQDIFGENRMCYTFEHRCKEDPNIILGDEACRVFLCSKGEIGARDDLAELLHYMEDSRIRNVQTETTKQIHELVEKVKHNHEVGVRFLKAIEYEEYIREKATAEGMAEGMAEGEVIGEIKGKRLKLIDLICKKVKKEKTLEQITDELEEEIEIIAPIYEQIQDYAEVNSISENNINNIYDALYLKEENSLKG